MPANTAPIYSLTPNVTSVAVGGTALAKSDGTGTGVGTDMFLAFTAGANGSFISRIRFIPVASAASTAVAATVLRVYVSTINSGATSNANTFLIAEINATAQTADQPTAVINFYEIPLNFALQSGKYILCSSHVINNASTNWMATCFGGDF